MASSAIEDEAKIVSQIIDDAGGEIVGRTRLQKIAYILEAMGEGFNLDFEYKHYGPYSEQLSTYVKYAEIFDFVSEEIRTATWGGNYSIFKNLISCETPPGTRRKAIVEVGNGANPIVLELTATAIFLAKQYGAADAWQETTNRKPDKATPERVESAKNLLSKFKSLDGNSLLPVEL